MKPLDRLPAGQRVYLDATVFIYHFAKASPQCSTLVKRVERAEVLGVTGAHTLAEVTHRLMIIGAVRRGLIRGGNLAAKLRAHRALVRGLSTYQTDVDALLAIGLEVLPLDAAALTASGAIRQTYGLLTNDSLNVALLQQAGVSILATSDRDFAEIPELQVYHPTDVSAPLEGSTDSPWRSSRRPPPAPQCNTPGSGISRPGPPTAACDPGESSKVGGAPRNRMRCRGKHATIPSTL